MAWIESHQSLLDHRKTLRFARELSVDQMTAIGHLHCFWWWCLDNAPTGTLTVIATQDIASGSRWEGDPELFSNALLSAGFINRKGKGLCVHDWYDYAGKLIERRKQNAEAKRAARLRRTSAGHPNDVPPPVSGMSGATVPNRTVPNQTLPSSRCLPPYSPPKEVDQRFAEVCKLYEAEIGPLTPIIAERLEEIVDEYPLSWWQEAVKVAARNGKRKLAYIEGVLRNYHTEGFQVEEEPEEEDGGDAVERLKAHYPRAFAGPD